MRRIERAHLAKQIARKKEIKMNVNELLSLYLSKEGYKDKKDALKLSNDNAMYFSTAYLFNIDIEKQFCYKINQFRYDYFLKKYDQETKNKIISDLNQFVGDKYYININ